MAHYNVNSGVPKTLIQHLIRWVESSGQFSVDVSQTLRVILVAEISPELVPVDEGERSQSTEAAIGPYALQDFNLYYYTLRFGFRPSKIAFLAMHAWKASSTGDWPSGLPADQRKHLRTRRHPTVVGSVSAAILCLQSVPNGPKVSAGSSLSPRGDWRAPSDGNAAAWLEDLSATFRVKLSAFRDA